MESVYDAKEFGKRLKSVRKKYGVTQEKLAEKLYLSTDSISNYENGKTTCMPEQSAQIEDIISTLQNCSAFDLSRISSMIQILLQTPAA